MNQAIKLVGDAISSLQTESTGQPIDTTVLQVLDKMAASPENKANAEPFDTPKMSLKSTIKIAAILTLLMVVLSLPALNTVMGKVFANTFIRLVVIAVIFFILAMFVVRKFA
jgi:hypothetical protein